MTDDEEIRKLATDLIRKLDVALPKINGAIAFLSTRSYVKQYDGPTFDEEIEGLRELLELPKPAAQPHEFYPPGYCERCTGSGEVPGGEGIRSRTTRMNMQRVIAEVLDENKAVDCLIKIRAAPDKQKALQMLEELPLNIEQICQKPVTAIDRDGKQTKTTFPCPPPEDADLSMFVIETQRPDHHVPKERRWKDICPDCRGTGGRGLPVAIAGWENGKMILATEVDD